MRIISLKTDREIVDKTVRLLNGPALLSRKFQLLHPSGWQSFRSKERAETLRDFLLRLLEEWLRCERTLMPKGFEVRAFSRGLPGPDLEWTISLTPKLVERISEKAFNAGKAKPAFTSWLWRSYWDWTERIPRYSWFEDDGFIFTYFQPFPVNGPPRELPADLRLDDETAVQWDEAILWFAYLLNSGHSELLERCGYCHRFYGRERMPKGSREGEPTCANCSTLAAKARTRSSRSRHKETLLGIAARASLDWKPSSRRASSTDFVLSKVNAELSRLRKDLKGKRWLTQNRLAIELRQKELVEHA